MASINRHSLDADRPVWEQQKGESSEVYAQFLLYRNMERRSLSDDRFGSSVSSVKESSVRWQWAHRVLEWDRHLQRVEDEALVRERMQMNQRHRTVARAAQAKIQQWLVQMDPLTLKPADAARWYEMAVRVEREATGAHLQAGDGTPVEEPQANPLADVSLHELLGVPEGEEKAALRGAYAMMRARRDVSQ